MTTDTTQTNEAPKAKKPTFTAKVRNGYGKKATYERIGVAFENADGSLYIKLAGTQIVSDFTLYRIEDRDAQNG